MLKLTQFLAPIVCATMVVAGVPRPAHAEESNGEETSKETEENSDETDETDETNDASSEYGGMPEETLRDQRSDHELYRGLGFGLIGFGALLTGLGIFGIARGATACNRRSPCETQTATGVLLGLLSTSSGLSSMGGGLAVVLWANHELRKINRHLSLGVAPRPNGAAATLKFRF